MTGAKSPTAFQKIQRTGISHDTERNSEWLRWNRREVSEGMGPVISTDMSPKRAGCTAMKDDQDGRR